MNWRKFLILMLTYIVVRAIETYLLGMVRYMLTLQDMRIELARTAMALDTMTRLARGEAAAPRRSTMHDKMNVNKN